MADSKIWNFVMEEVLNPITIYADKKSASSGKKEKDKSKYFYFSKKFKDNEINLAIKKSHAFIGGFGALGAAVIIILIIIICCLVKRNRRYSQN